MSIRGGDPARAGRAVDRALGGQRPPTAAQMFAARRPLVAGLVAGLVSWGLFLLASEGDVLPASGTGVLAGGWFAMSARLERARQRRLVRRGPWEGGPAPGGMRVLARRRVPGENLRPLCEVLAHVAEHGLEESEWAAVEAALPGTDLERDTWHTLRVTGRRAFTLRIAAVRESTDVCVEIHGAPGGRGKSLIAGVLHVLGGYRVR